MRATLRRQTLCLFLIVSGLATVFAPCSSAQDAAKAPQPLEPVSIPLKEGIGEGWTQTVEVNSGDEPGDAYRLWVENGWFYVRSTDEHGDLDWQIKLAKLSEVGAPSIAMIREGSAFHVSSQNGRYFIRETGYLLRSVRQRSESDGAVQRDELLPERFESAGWGKVSPERQLTLSSWQDGSWFYAASGPDEQRFNCLIRLDSWREGKGGNGFRSIAGDFAQVIRGETDLWDDGELLFATRTLRSSYERELVRKKLRENLRGSVPPEIDAAQWLNSEGLKWQELEGKVVLLDFWATWCGPCVQKLPDVQALADQYADQGLVVIGIHSESGADKCPEFVETNKLTFPIAVDSGETVNRYAIDSFPSYFLIDKAGNVVDGYSAKLPDEELIQQLLNVEVGDTASE